MKLTSPKTAIIFAVCLGYVPLLVHGVPVDRHTGVVARGIVPPGVSASLDPFVSPNGTEKVARNEDGPYWKVRSDVADIERRAFVFPKVPKTEPEPETPPPPPPPPEQVPRPQPAPGPSRPKAPPPVRKNPPKEAPNFRNPDNVNPGPGQGLGDDPKKMSDYEAAGAKQIKNYNEAMARGTEDTPILESKEEVAKHPPNTAFLDYRKNTGYRVTTDASKKLSSLQSVWAYSEEELGFNIRDTDKVTQITVRKSDANEDQLVTEGSYDPEGKIIVYQNAFKEQNLQVTDPIPLNEIAMQNFIRVAGDNTRNLKAAFITDIQNKGFFDITRENYNDKHENFNTVLTFEAGSAEFNRYIGSDNIKSKMFSFINHHFAIGDKKIEKIVVAPMQADKADHELSIAIVFKDAGSGT